LEFQDLADKEEKEKIKREQAASQVAVSMSNERKEDND
jgi:hypothetical protein